MKKKEIIQEVMEKAGVSEEVVLKVVEETLGVIFGELVKGKDVEISKFGKFKVKNRVAGQVIPNPRTGVPMKILPYTTVTFLPSTVMKRALKEARE